MDPRTANLDPKLKEAYERIMGTAVSPPQKTNPQTPSNPAAKPIESAPLQTPKLQVHEVLPEPLEIPQVKPPPLPAQPQQQAPSNEMVQSPVFNATKNPFINPFPPPADILRKNTNTILNNDTSPKKKGKLIPILLTLGGLIFFVLYGVIWAKIFSLF